MLSFLQSVSGNPVKSSIASGFLLLLLGGSAGADAGMTELGTLESIYMIIIKSLLTSLCQREELYPLFLRLGRIRWGGKVEGKSSSSRPKGGKRNRTFDKKWNCRNITKPGSRGKIKKRQGFWPCLLTLKNSRLVTGC